VHLRRTLLLFALVLGVTALVASIFHPGERSAAPQPPPAPSVGIAPVHGRSTERVLRFNSRGRAITRRLRQGSEATVTVRVGAAGLVELHGLDLEDTAEPLTPATFDVFANTVGRYPVRFRPAAGGRRKRIGTLVVEPARRGSPLAAPVRSS
jgi:hypothetical protein